MTLNPAVKDLFAFAYEDFTLTGTSRIRISRPRSRCDGAGAGPDRRIETILVAAIAENGVIGRDNKLPWRIKSDLQYFKRVTMGKPMVMGRKTYLSIGKPLPGRTNIVVTRDRDLFRAGRHRRAFALDRRWRSRAGMRCGAAPMRSP